MVLRLHGFSVQNRTAGSYGALSTTVQIKGFNLDVIPVAVRGFRGKQAATGNACITLMPFSQAVFVSRYILACFD